MDMTIYCIKTKKVRFHSKLEANIALSNIQFQGVKHRLRGDRGPTPTRSYRCGFCSGYHLTSQDKIEAGEIHIEGTRVERLTTKDPH